MIKNFTYHLLKNRLFVAILLMYGSVAAYGQQRICVGSIKNYGVDTNENGGIGTSGSVYTWRVIEAQFEGHISSETSSGNKIIIDWQNSPMGAYTLEVKEINECNDEMVRNLQVIIQDRMNLELPPIIYLCPNYGMTQLSSPQDFEAYAWYNAQGELIGTSKTIEVTEAGTYRLVVRSGGCETEASTQVELVEFPTFAVQSDVNNSLIVVANGGNTNVLYQLEDLEGNVLKPWQISSRFRYVNKGKYIVKVRSENGECYTDLHAEAFVLTNVITPNNDGINDVWDLSQVLVNYLNAEIQVFNRFGKLIKTIDQFDQFKWDGKIDGKPIPSESYWYKIDLKNGQQMEGSLLIKNY